ncbi:MAG: hypothetical protein AMXMBFR61_10890 [Fimbriimonadales bacterium]
MDIVHEKRPHISHGLPLKQPLIGTVHPYRPATGLPYERRLNGVKQESFSGALGTADEEPRLTRVQESLSRSKGLEVVGGFGNTTCPVA